MAVSQKPAAASSQRAISGLVIFMVTLESMEERTIGLSLYFFVVGNEANQDKQGLHGHHCIERQVDDADEDPQAFIGERAPKSNNPLVSPQSCFRRPGSKDVPEVLYPNLWLL